MKPRTEEISAIPQGAVLEHLGKVLSSQLFQGAERSANLLRFLVEQTVNGQTDRLKEYTLGTEALGKASSFDPRTDTIVRAEVWRLRNRLDKYYGSEGQADSLVIALSKGSYVPRFQYRALPPVSVAGVEEKLPWRPKNITWLAFGLGAAACVLAIVMWGLWRLPQPASAVSIAVLPFANVSADAGQEFFSDGMTDEISAALANVKSLRVIARTSAFQFKGQNSDVRAIGQTLGATHVIEGSVRKVGDRVRITAQLVKADDGSQLWSEIYDRQLTDIFAIQEDIAQSIVASLRVPLGLAHGDTLVRDRTKDLESYEQYLRARGLVRTRGRKPITDAIALLEQVVARDPLFAPGWALLAQAYVLQPANTTVLRLVPLDQARRLVQSWLDSTERAAREAIRLDSRNALAYAALARAQQYRGMWMEAEDLYKQALALDPDEPEVLANYAFMLDVTGRVKEALSIGEKLRALEPLVPNFTVVVALRMQENGQNAASIPILGAISPNPNAGGALLRNTYLAQAYAQEGRYAEAADTLLLITDNDPYPRRSVEAAARLLRTAPVKVKELGSLPILAGGLVFVYAHVGAFDRVLENIGARSLEIGLNLGALTGWLPVYAPVRKTGLFKAYVRNAGLVDYWRARGWPDLCHPVGANDFACD